MGEIKWRGRLVFLNDALTSEPVEAPGNRDRSLAYRVWPGAVGALPHVHAAIRQALVPLLRYLVSVYRVRPGPSMLVSVNGHHSDGSSAT